MTLAAALLFDATFFNTISITGGQEGITIQAKWLGTSAFFNFNGHAMFLLSLAVLVVAVVIVQLVRKGTVGRNLAAMRGSETATAGLGVNPTWQRIVVFALSGAIAGVGGLLHSMEQQVVNPTDWNTDFSLVLVVLVVTTSVTTVEGAIQAGVGFFVTEQILTTVLLGPDRRVEPDGRAVRFRRPDLRRRTPRACSSTRSGGGISASSGSSSAAARPTSPPAASRPHMPMANATPLLTLARRVQVVRRDPGRARASPSTWRRANASVSSDRTAPARPPSSIASAGSFAPRWARSCSTGHPSIGLPTYRRARLGIGRTYQKVEVFTDMSVRDHLLVAERARRGEGRLWRDLLNLSKPTADELDRVAATLELVGITHLADTSVNALGLGNCRLVELARALAAEPKILLADEPSSGLDLHETAEVAAVLRTVQRERGTAVLLVEHDLSMVGDVVDRAIVMDLGAMLAEGTFDEVMADPNVRHAYLGQMGIA